MCGVNECDKVLVVMREVDVVVLRKEWRCWTNSKRGCGCQEFDDLSLIRQDA